MGAAFVELSLCRDQYIELGTVDYIRLFCFVVIGNGFVRELVEESERV